MVFSKPVRGLVHVAYGVGVIGAVGVNVAYRWVQRKHKKEDYCLVPLELAKSRTKCVQLLGGGNLKMKNINLRKMEVTPTKFKAALPVWGNTRGANIYTKSTRNDKDDRWQLQYAVFVVDSKQQSWAIWLHPEDGNYEGDDLPSEAQDLGS